MPSEVPNLSFSSRIKVHLGLTGKRFEIRHYSYNLPLPCIKMKTLQYITLGFIFLISCQSKTDTTGIQNGDIIFQTSTSGQSKAIQIATGSKYSHMGIIYKLGNDFLSFTKLYNL